MAIFLTLFCFGHKIPQDESFSKPFSPMIYILAIFSNDTHKGQHYGHNWLHHNTHYGNNGHYGCFGSTNYGCKFYLYGCSWKICSKCRSPMKTVSKKIHPTVFYGQNKKIHFQHFFNFQFVPFVFYFVPNLTQQASLHLVFKKIQFEIFHLWEKRSHVTDCNHRQVGGN